MPKVFSDKEREYIIKDLKKAANECLTLYGVKKTTVDELVKRANIPKGTFYLFYKSKELLLFDVLIDIHNEIQQNFLSEMAAFQGRLTCEKLTNLLYQIFICLDETCLLKILTNGDLELLMRKLPEEKVQEHLAHDDFSMEQLIRFIPQAQNKNIESFSGAFRGLFLTMLHKREIGEEIFEDSIKLLLQGLIIQLLEE